MIFAMSIRIRNIAEKPSVANQIATVLSAGMARAEMGKSKFCKIYEFSYGYQGMNAVMIVTSVLGHILKHDFNERYSSWQSTDPAELLDAPIFESKSEVLYEL
jgi:DNA topoisomerase III